MDCNGLSLQITHKFPGLFFGPEFAFVEARLSLPSDRIRVAKFCYITERTIEKSFRLVNCRGFYLASRQRPALCPNALNPSPKRLQPAHSNQTQPDVEHPWPSAWVA